MFIALGVAVAVFVLLLVVGAITGRVKVKSCCAIADPRHDLRMRGAYIDALPVDAPGRTDVHSELDRS